MATVPGERRGFHHGDLASALVAAASDLIAVRGGADFSLREVAESVGVSHTAAYRHFAAKADLLAEIAARGFARLDAAVTAAIVRRGDGVDAPASLRATGLAYLDFAELNPGAYRVMFLAELCDSSRHPALVAAASRALLTLVGVVAAGQAAGDLRADPSAEIIAAAIWAAVHGHALLLLDGQIRDGAVGPAAAPPADRSFLIDAIVLGIAARRG
ncbi:MAG: WHG domain-containing protein [Siculibacillus sp.]|nr:WHG domain-containing protein [Siculibacillus sp.]